jgi:hypothetical protein
MDLKTWAIRLVTVAVSAGLYVLAALVLKDTGAYEPVLLLAGGVVGLLMPQVGKAAAALLLFALCVNVTACSAVKPVVRDVSHAATILCETAYGVDQQAARAGLSVEDFCRIHDVLAPFIDEATRAQRVAAGRAGLPPPGGGQ